MSVDIIAPLLRSTMGMHCIAVLYIFIWAERDSRNPRSNVQIRFYASMLLSRLFDHDTRGH